MSAQTSMTGLVFTMFNKVCIKSESNTLYFIGVAS